MSVLLCVYNGDQMGSFNLLIIFVIFIIGAVKPLPLGGGYKRLAI